MDTEVGVRRDISPLARVLSERVFLWAKLVVGEIPMASAPSLDWLKQKITAMPSTVEGLY